MPTKSSVVMMYSNQSPTPEFLTFQFLTVMNNNNCVTVIVLSSYLLGSISEVKLLGRETS